MVQQFKNLPDNAGHTGSNPGPGTKIPHASGQLSPVRHDYWAHQRATTEAPAPILHKRSHHSERPAHRDEEGPRSPRREKARAAVKTLHSQK